MGDEKAEMTSECRRETFSLWERSAWKSRTLREAFREWICDLTASAFALLLL